MDERTDRIGEHAVQAQPEWALRTLGPVPDEPGERLDWQQRASAIGAYRELCSIDNERTGKLAYLKVGRRRIITRQHLEAFLTRTTT